MSDLAQQLERAEAQLADIEEYGTAEINTAVDLRRLLTEALVLLTVIGDAAKAPEGQRFPVAVHGGRHLTAAYVQRCADMCARIWTGLDIS